MNESFRMRRKVGRTGGDGGRSFVGPLDYVSKRLASVNPRAVEPASVVNAELDARLDGDPADVDDPALA